MRESGGEPGAAPATIELFDLASDPGEQRNLAESNPGKVQELRVRYQALADQAAPPKLKTPKVWGEAK